MTEYTKPLLSIDAGARVLVASVPGAPGLSVWIAASGADAPNILGAIVRVFGLCGGIRAQLGGDVVITSVQQHVVTLRGWGVESFDVELVGGAAPATRVCVTACTIGDRA